MGRVKLLKHNVTGKVRLLMRQSRTLKICANHLSESCFSCSFVLFFFSLYFIYFFFVFFLDFTVVRGMSVQQHAGNEKSCVWNATDFSSDELKDELFCIRFSSIESKCIIIILCLLISKKKTRLLLSILFLRLEKELLRNKKLKEIKVEGNNVVTFYALIF